ncbi:Uncharacterized protein FWK35_00005460 [Aphis craccivora]|uniref:Uncharacterized protein n=1 Tax=Aphis craccivora TaxID=307492 RepID=A0A6G0Z5A3_APHCR|nr:Uncharacterized protein FWK35_00005460 [Aphis craccivora]
MVGGKATIRTTHKEPCITFSSFLNYNRLKKLICSKTGFPNSERSDECIIFTMMCAFFLCLSPRFGAVKVLRFLNSAPLSDKNVNLVDTLGDKSKKFPIVLKSIRKNPKKEFLRKTSFRHNRFFYMVVIKKIITINT